MAGLRPGICMIPVPSLTVLVCAPIQAMVDTAGLDDGYSIQSNGLWFVTDAGATIEGQITVLGGVSETFVAGGLTLTAGLLFRL